MTVKVIGLDTAKHVFQVHGADASGRAVLKKRLRRNQIADFFADLPKCLVGIEATRGAHYWAREPAHHANVAALAGDRRNPAETALGWDAELLLSGSGLTHKLFLMRAVNRSAVVVVPKQPFLDWLHHVDSSSGKLTLTDLANDPSIYLLPECDLESELEVHFKKACLKIFEDQLNGWYRAEELWPEDRSLEIFRLWFDHRFHFVLFDLGKQPLIAENL